MNFAEIIEKKKRGGVLEYEELKYAIDGYVSGEVADYQMSALLMAIFINGMEDSEIFAMADVMRHSGDELDLSVINGVCVDKHSTGGMGDTTTLIVAPTVASLGLKFAKMSGRGLGVTGGTIDKLESIRGFKTTLSGDDFIKQINDIGVAVIEQSMNLCPADKKLYALRDVTGTVDSIPLIAASIMSKKLVSGSDYIFLDVKCGNGAFMKDISSALKLAVKMKTIGESAGKNVEFVVSDMNEPLSDYIGNAVEVYGALEVLSGKKCKLYELSRHISAKLLFMAKNIKFGDALKEVDGVIERGEAKAKFFEFIEAQGGIIENENELLCDSVDVMASATGYVKSINCNKLGQIVCDMGGGRLKKGDVIDAKVGLKILKRVGDQVRIGETIAKLFYSKSSQKRFVQDVQNCYSITDKPTEKLKLLIDTRD